jgi:hypothetical protein
MTNRIGDWDSPRENFRFEACGDLRRDSMALPESTAVTSVGAPFGSDLHGFIEQYERAYPDEVLHIEEPLNAE